MTKLATPEGTAAYAREHAAAPGHYRDALGLTLSSIGFGSYLGAENDEGDAAYQAAFESGLASGVNVLDTALSYRSMRSERAVGRALRASSARRDGVLVATKGGFVAFDAAGELPPVEQFQRDWIDTGIVAPEDVVGGAHVMTPRYLERALARSLSNLQLDGVDVYFVHNPETQLDAGVPRATVESRLREVFAMLERQRAAGRIGMYGLATWGGFRRPPGHPGHLSLARILALAEEVGGERHGLRAAELPYSIAMPEAGRSPTQDWNGRRVPFLQAAREARLLVLGSATLAQAQLLRRMPDPVRASLGGATALEAALQFSRSTPGITTALVGTGRPAHAAQNAAVARLPLAPEAAARLLGG